MYLAQTIGAVLEPRPLIEMQKGDEVRVNVGRYYMSGPMGVFSRTVEVFYLKHQYGYFLDGRKKWCMKKQHNVPVFLANIGYRMT